MCQNDWLILFLVYLIWTENERRNSYEIKTSNLFILLAHMHIYFFQWVKVRGGCSFCWCWWNCFPSLFKLSFHIYILFLFTLSNTTSPFSLWTFWLTFYCLCCMTITIFFNRVTNSKTIAPCPLHRNRKYNFRCTHSYKRLRLDNLDFGVCVTER